MKANEFPVNWATTTDLAEYFDMHISSLLMNLQAVGLFDEGDGGYRLTETGKRYSDSSAQDSLMWDKDAIEALFSAAAPTAGLAEEGDGSHRAPLGDSRGGGAVGEYQKTDLSFFLWTEHGLYEVGIDGRARH